MLLQYVRTGSWRRVRRESCPRDPCQQRTRLRIATLHQGAAAQRSAGALGETRRLFFLASLRRDAGHARPCSSVELQWRHCTALRCTGALHRRTRAPRLPLPMPTTCFCRWDEVLRAATFGHVIVEGAGQSGSAAAGFPRTRCCVGVCTAQGPLAFPPFAHACVARVFGLAAPGARAPSQSRRPAKMSFVFGKRCRQLEPLKAAPKHAAKWKFDVTLGS
jgi:hypothetical protein